MANSFNVASILANMGLYFLKNELGMANMVYRGHEKEWREINGHKVGDTVYIDRPPRFRAVDGPDITGNVQDVVYGKTSIKLNIQKTVPFQFDSRGLTTEADVRRVGAEAMKAAASEIAETIETALTGLYKKVANFHGTPGTAITSTKFVGEVGAAMTNLGVPKTGRMALLTPGTKLELAEQMKTLYIDTKNKTALERTKLGPVHNFDTYESASLQAHTPGTWNAMPGTALVNGAAQVSAYTAVKDTWVQNLNIDTLTGSAVLRAGDVFTIAGVFEVNPGTHQSTGRLRNFVVTADATMSSGAGTIVISPPIIPVSSASLLDKANATVDAAPADNAVIVTRSGSTTTSSGPFKQNLFFHKNAFALVMKPLQKLDSFTVWEQKNIEGLSLTLSKGGDILKHSEVWRLDALFGVEAPQIELAFRGTE